MWPTRHLHVFEHDGGGVAPAGGGQGASCHSGLLGLLNSSAPQGGAELEQLLQSLLASTGGGRGGARLGPFLAGFLFCTVLVFLFWCAAPLPHCPLTPATAPCQPPRLRLANRTPLCHTAHLAPQVPPARR